MVFILLSSIQLAITNPLNDPNGITESAMFWIDVATTIVFALEAIMKIIAFGFLLNGKHSYLRNPWNLLDFIILILSIISLTPIQGNLSIFKIFRIVRTVRTLRLISRNEGLKVGV